MAPHEKELTGWLKEEMPELESSQSQDSRALEDLVWIQRMLREAVHGKKTRRKTAIREPVLEHSSSDFFRELATRTAEELDKAFACYYPVEGDNDVSEALTAMYFAFQLRDKGFRIYPQVQCTGAIHDHLDMAAIHPGSKTVLLIEAKRLYSSERAALLGQDWQRLRGSIITSKLRSIARGYRYFACLLATTWDEKYRNWWGDEARGPAPGRSNPSDWKNLREALGHAQLNRCVTVPMARLGWKRSLDVLFSFIPIKRAA